jgi:hypothetical protein
MIHCIKRIATTGVISIIPMRGTTRRSGARMGSVMSKINVTRKWPGGRLNQESSARTTIAMLRIWMRISTKVRSADTAVTGMVVLQK